MTSAIFILTQNNLVRRLYLKTCLYFLFKNFNERFQYPVIIFHEGDYDAQAKEEILKSVRSSCRGLISFKLLDAEDFKVPVHIDQTKLQKCVDIKATPYWRNIPYRNMCRWWIVHMPKYAKQYDYIMRIDDDLIIEDAINTDIIAEAASNKVVYVSNMIHVDCPLCCFGFKELLCSMMPERQAFIEKLFQKQDVPLKNPQIASFKELLSVTDPEATNKSNVTLWSPIMNYNNFHITKSSFWLREDVQKAIQTIDDSGLIYYYRLGDSPIQSMLTMLYAEPTELGRVTFRYSKRMQREAFDGCDGKLYSYMPSNYKETSDITQK